MLGAVLWHHAVRFHEHCCINGRWQCRCGVRWRPRKVVLPMGVFTRQHTMPDPNAPRSKWAASDIELSSRFPALTEYLTEAVMDDGKHRVTSTITISCEDGVWKACLNDRPQHQGDWLFQLYKSSDTFEGALAALDGALQDGTAEWRKLPPFQKTGRR
jgi:hypothetical protein